MKLTVKGLSDAAYTQKGYLLPQFDIEKVRAESIAAPKWVHFGAGNIFRAFPAVLCQKLLETGKWSHGITVVECYDEEIIDKAFTPFDNLTLAVSLKSDGSTEKRVVASVCEAIGYAGHKARVMEIFAKEGLQMVSMTITEKGYAVVDAAGKPLDFCVGDFESKGNPVSIVGKLTALLLYRYETCRGKLAMVSMDNCSHNGTTLQNSILLIARSWVKCGLAPQEFVDYLLDDQTVSFTWSMIDKITPRPSETVIQMLEQDGFEGAQVVVTTKNTYVSGMVNAEECEYLAIEDNFPNGRPPLEATGVIFGNRETVDRIERMKVCTCLNPLHTCLAIYGCLLSYDKICDEMKDDDLVALIKQIGYIEGMPVVTDPKIMSAKGFIDEVVNLRLPNPFMPDSPQRIACDTSKKLPVRFGETLKAYLESGKKDLSFLTFIPLVCAGYARYLTGINDKGEAFEISPDPALDTLHPLFDEFRLDGSFPASKAHSLFADTSIFGVDLYAVGLGEKVEQMFSELSGAPSAVRTTIQKYLAQAK